MRRHSYALLGGAGVLLLVCCFLVVVVGAVVRFGRLCSVGNIGGARSITVQAGQTTSSVMACGGSVLIAGHVTENVTAYGGSVTVAPNAQVDGDVSSYGGGVEIAGTVGGDVTAYGGAVHVLGGGVVNGDVTAYGNHVMTDAGSQVHVGSIHERAGSGWAGGIFAPLNGFPFSFSFWTVLVWGMIAVGLVHWLPRRTMRVGEVIFNRLGRSLIVGTLSWVLGLVLAFILAFTIIGIPLSLAITVVLIAGAVLGEAAVSWTVGRIVLRRVAPRRSGAILEVLVGVVVLALLGAIPFLGAVLNLVLAVVGAGAALLSRFGSRRWGSGSPGRWVA
jgi:cytoskeletal protein CcmA (bactofilin family)